jgi:hypothetical protein
VKRLAHILLNTATVLSLLLCIGSAFIWANDGAVYVRGNPQFFAVSHNGDLDLGVSQRMVTVPLLIPAVIGFILPLFRLRDRLAAREAAQHGQQQ